MRDARGTTPMARTNTAVATRRGFLARLAAAGALVAARSRAALSEPAPGADLPLVDYHVHLSDRLGIERALELARARGVRLGIVDHPGVDVGGYRSIQTDAQLGAYVRELRRHPVYVGLQPVYPGWSDAFSQPVLSQLDYVLMDALAVPKPEGGWMYLWAADVFLEDEEAFMERYTDHILRILRTEPIDVFAWPTYLPACIARDYRRLWTKPRTRAILEAAKQAGIAIEINEVARVPDRSFILAAKQAGLKFTFGTDARNDNAGRFYYCLRMTEACGLTRDDIFEP